ncbi:ABC transporter substrate-binding protein [Sulfurospirillum sp. 1307]|jgi:phospholipid transport system substrate-binding protein
MKNIILIICLLTSSLFALQKEEIIPSMTSKIDQATSILRNEKDLSIEQKANKIFNLLDEVFDYDLMARLSLGKTNWNNLTSEQKKEFTKKFEKHLKHSYMDKLNLYTDEKIKILDLKEVKKNRLWLITQLVSNKDKYEITYKFYRKKTGDWKIYDVNIIGVSIIQSYRVQFADTLKNATFTALLDKLK